MTSDVMEATVRILEAILSQVNPQELVGSQGAERVDKKRDPDEVGDAVGKLYAKVYAAVIKPLPS